jgi:hypothetical protein
MADIRQAAKWMREGKRVRRPSHKYECYTLATDDYAVIMHLAKFDAAVFVLGDLLADDWEIAD